jgi:hypothetical protein
MSEPKPFASLSPSLLARKGGARPAMRPQLMPLTYEEQRRMGYAVAALAEADHSDHNFGEVNGDDLGWNDMGEDAAAPVHANGNADVVAIAADPLPEPSQPEVLRRIESLAGAIRQNGVPVTPVPSTKPVAPRQRGTALKEGRKAAFTLRLDAERHLRLRLACTVENRSAQQLVVDALDRFLETKPGLDDLARRARQS